MYDDFVLFTAHRASLRNRAQIELSKECGCFHCLKKFPPTEIINWCDHGKTALCPYCGLDAVLGDASRLEWSDALLSAMKNRFFGHSQ